jgi:hypothetical protein
MRALRTCGWLSTIHSDRRLAGHCQTPCGERELFVSLLLAPSNRYAGGVTATPAQVDMLIVELKNHVYRVGRSVGLPDTGVGYEVLGRPSGCWPWQIASGLGRVFRRCVEAGVPFLNAIAVGKRTRVPGAAFWSKADELGVYNGPIPDANDLSPQARQFWEQEYIRAVTYPGWRPGSQLP